MPGEKQSPFSAEDDPPKDPPPICVPGSPGPDDPMHLFPVGEENASERSSLQDFVDTEPSADGLEPRIIRDGLIDAMLDWVRDYCDQLASSHAPAHVLEKAREEMGVMASLRHDLICLERSIELVGREKAGGLIELAGSIRAEIIRLYERMAASL